MSGPFIDFSCSLNMGLNEVMCASAELWEEGTHECFVGEGWDQGHHKYRRVCMDLPTGMDIFKAGDECWVI